MTSLQAFQMQIGHLSITVTRSLALPTLSALELSHGVQKKQPIITLSSTEAEYVALTHATKDILWIPKLLQKLTFLHSLSLPTTLYCDKQGMIHLSTDSTFHSCTKHIDIHFHFIHQTVASRNIKLVYIPTKDMMADIFTKSLAHVTFEKF